MKELVINFLKSAFVLEISNFFEFNDDEIIVKLLDGTKAKIITKHLS